MNMIWIDWLIVGALLTFIVAMAVYTKHYTQSVADFLAANRCARRYLLSISQGMAGLGAVSVIAVFEMYYRSGFTGAWWSMLLMPVALIIALSGWVNYRYRETRVFTLAQFFEVRYSKSFRVFCGILAWISGIINFGIFPAVGARFFIYFCGLPHEICGIATYPLVMIILLSIALFFVFLGGQIAVMVTDFIQGMFTNVSLLIIILFIFWKFDWSTLIEGLQAAPADASLINPFKTSKMSDFNFFYFIIAVMYSFYVQRTWQGSQGYACSAKSAHELKMGGILGEWRGLVLTLLLMMLPITAYVIMHHPGFSALAGEVSSAVAGISNPAVQNQMRVPLVLAKLLPPGILGIFAAIMLAAFISTHDTYLHSWGSIFIQDVILPFRKKPFTPRQHMWLLRFSVLFVAIFIFTFSMLFHQNEYILMFMVITGAIFIGGAGAVIIGGLYWPRGSTKGAWASMLIGCSLALTSIVLRQAWKPHIYPWMISNTPGMLSNLKWLIEGISAKIPGINWKVGPEKFPINSQWISLFTILCSLSGYVLFSLLDSLVLKKPLFDLDHLLHRGKYAIKNEHEHNVSKPPTGIKALLPSAEFSTGDKVIYYAKLCWTFSWIGIFLVGTIYCLCINTNVSDASWAKFWAFKVGITLVIGAGTTVWFFIGGLADIRDLFKTLSSAKRNAMDVGMVVNHHNLEEDLPEVPLDEAEKAIEEDFPEDKSDESAPKAKI